MCVELEFAEANTCDLILGNTTVLIAKDAEYLPVSIKSTHSSNNYTTKYVTNTKCLNLF